jgi:hypothetical protein
MEEAMDIKQYCKLTTITLNDVALKPCDLGFMEISKNGNTRLTFKPVLAGIMHKEANHALREIIKIMEFQEEGL